VLNIKFRLVFRGRLLSPCRDFAANPLSFFTIVHNTAEFTLLSLFFGHVFAAMLFSLDKASVRSYVPSSHLPFSISNSGVGRWAPRSPQPPAMSNQPTTTSPTNCKRQYDLQGDAALLIALFVATVPFHQRPEQEHWPALRLRPWPCGASQSRNQPPSLEVKVRRDLRCSR
jgi:hypothetical protein